jgi:hypothetical protein
MTDGVVIVGGGASGTLTAVALARFPEIGPVTVVDTTGAFARGVAYSTEEPQHLLNVPAARMSALPDEPAHLLAWLTARGDRADPEAFLQRRLYGAYLGELLGAAGSQVRRVVDRVLALAPDGPGLRVELAGRPPLHARAGVLALGNFPPSFLRGGPPFHPGWPGARPGRPATTGRRRTSRSSSSARRSPRWTWCSRSSPAGIAAASISSPAAASSP